MRAIAVIYLIRRDIDEMRIGTFFLQPVNQVLRRFDIRTIRVSRRPFAGINVGQRRCMYDDIGVHPVQHRIDLGRLGQVAWPEFVGSSTMRHTRSLVSGREIVYQSGSQEA